MKDTYGYGPLSYELIELFRSGKPDFAAAEDLIIRGADVNDQGNDKTENVLSEILYGYWQSGTEDSTQEECYCCESSSDRCRTCAHNSNPEPGIAMLSIISFFLSHGFDVNKKNGLHGAQCLFALTLSSFDRHMIYAIKMLLDAGAKNLRVGDNSGDTPMSFVSMEGSYQGVCEGNHYAGNIYEAAYRVYEAAEKGMPYAGIDSFEAAIGEKIIAVKAVCQKPESIFFSVDLPESKHDNCFTQRLYFYLENGKYLVYTDKASCWVDNTYPGAPLVDISSHFPGLIGSTLKDITFSHRSVIKGTTHYGQPITTFSMSSGAEINFTINFGEVEKSEYCAYYYYGKES